jgi:hypothetical protein
MPLYQACFCDHIGRTPWILYVGEDVPDHAGTEMDYLVFCRTARRLFDVRRVGSLGGGLGRAALVQQGRLARVWQGARECGHALKGTCLRTTTATAWGENESIPDGVDCGTGMLG